MFLANRSAELVRLACRALCRRCENVLVTDMLWPAYRAVLEDECRQQRRTLTTLAVQNPILHDGIGQAELVDQLLECYSGENCDGLFLSAVTCHGVRLPIPAIVPAVSRVRRPAFVVADAAQAVNHMPLRSTAPHCDFLVAGCHKWLRAYHPMGLGFCCSPSADSIVAETRREMIERGDLDDPLLSFTWELENGPCEAFSETVNLAPLFTTAAAVSRIWQSPLGRIEAFDRQVANTDCVAEAADSIGWQPVRPAAALRSGILLLQAKRRETRSAPPDTLRLAFRHWGLAVSAYVGGLIRMSFLADTLAAPGLSQVRSALGRCA
jgi:selenocysteine lyase/cysteine desulfurase